MNKNDFNKAVEEQIKRSRELLVCKGEEYDADSGDRLHSFKVAAALVGGGQAKALAGMMAKHTVSVYDMCENPTAYTEDRWNEKITDSINYLLILKAVIKEELQK